MSKDKFNVFYKDYEKAMSQIEKQKIQISNYQVENYSLKQDLKLLTKKFDEVKKQNLLLLQKISDLTDKISELTTKIGVNSTNSSVPPSTNPIKKKASNEFNSREKSEKKKGGQKGHKGSTLKKEKALELLKDPEVIHEKKIYKVKGNSKKSPITKYKIDIRIKTVVIEEIYTFCSDGDTLVIPDSEVSYGNVLKAFCTELNVFHYVAAKRLTSFIDSITQGKIKISPGSIINFIKEAGSKCNDTINKLTNKLLESKILYTDETPTKGFDSTCRIRTYISKLGKIVVYKCNPKKNKEYVELDDILPNYLYTLVHDHETLMYNYATRHGECNAHILRYLRQVEELPETTSWAKKMINFLLMLKTEKEKLIGEGKKYISENKLDEINRQYDEILELGEKESRAIKSGYNRKISHSLFSRMKKYKEEHLLFIKDFNVSFDNNISELMLRIIKCKTKICGCFRSLEGGKMFANIMSIIQTANMRNIPVHKAITNLINNEPVFE